MKDSHNFPTYPDDSLVSPIDLRPGNRYYYYCMDVDNRSGKESNFGWSVPTIKSFYLKSPKLIKGWWKDYYMSRDEKTNPTTDLKHLVVAAFDDTTSRISDTPLIINRQVTRPKDNDEKGFLVDRNVYNIDTGLRTFFSSSKKHCYIFKSKKDALIHLITRTEKSIEEVKKGISYLKNQLYGIKKNKLKYFPTSKINSLPNLIPEGSEIWFSSIHTHCWNYGVEYYMRYGSLSSEITYPTKITIDSPINWKDGGRIESRDLTINCSTYREWIGRTEEECISQFYSGMQADYEKTLETMNYHLESQTTRLRGMKKTLGRML